MSGQHDFNEVVFEDAFVPDDHVLGEIDGAWKQATSELAYERSGPERFLETFYLLLELIRTIGPEPDTRSAEGLGRLVAQLHTLRRMSVSVAGMLQAGKEPVVEAAIVKDLGTIWEQNLPNRVRELTAFVPPEISPSRAAPLKSCAASSRADWASGRSIWPRSENFYARNQSLWSVPRPTCKDCADEFCKRF